MKIFFAIAVLVAVVYLAIPENASDQLKQYFPQAKIEQAASSLLSQVDEKLNTVKQQLLAQQNERITLLEDKVTKLQLQLAKERRINSEFFENESLSEKKHNSQEFVLPEPTKESVPQLANQPIKAELANDKQRRINRQLQLQEIAERMNQSSLLTLVDN